MMMFNNVNRIFLSLSLLIFLAKLWMFTYMFGFDDFVFFGGDSDYYHQYAIGAIKGEAANFWPVMLKYINSLGLYSREVFSYGIMLISLLLLPLLLAFLIWRITKSVVLASSLYIYSMIYPTQILYSFDIYRDLLMAFLFILSITLMYTHYYSISLGRKLFFSSLLLFVLTTLSLLRPYLGISLLLSYLFLTFYPFRKCNLKLIFIVYFFSFFILFNLNVFDLLINYRSSFSTMEGGTNLNIRMNGDNYFSFVLLILKSFYYQILGGYFAKFESIMVFILESLPVITAIFYISKNSKHLNKFALSLLIFFMIYSSVWLIGNDNFGTGMRLRIYSYYSILICMAVVYKNKAKGII